MKDIINKFLIGLTGYRLIRNSTIVGYLDILNLNSYEFLELVQDYKDDHYILSSFFQSKSQILQDIFVLSQLNYKKNGFFVEFGATDGITLSNTFLLEKSYQWKGILVEPSKKFHKNLYQNRNCIIDNRCVYSQSGLSILFNEVEWGEMSTIDKYSNEDGHSIFRKKGFKYDVKTVSLKDLLDEHNAPMVIDYLSIDTEGSEYDILEAFSFKDYQFRIITVEHNYIEFKRNKIKELLESNGYRRVQERLSKWDDWYINLDLKK